MIDFHTHILPGIDDGSQSISESIALLRAEYAQGVEAVVLTPHFYAHQNSPETFLKRRRQAWQALKPYLDSRMPRPFLGAEVQYFEGICGMREIRQLMIEQTDYLLLEMPFTRWTDRVVSDAVSLNNRGDIVVVLAHIERYISMQPKEVWEYLRKSGLLMQVNASFFESWRTKHKAMSMLEKGEIHLLGSDCHNMNSRRPNWDQVPAKAKLIAKGLKAYDAFYEPETL